MPVVACLGASLTAGSVSADYVAMLEARLGPAGFRFINHGVNSDLAWNGLRRIGKLIADRPDFVTVLIGTNDVNATLSERNRLRYLTFNHLPIPQPTVAWYEENLRAIVRRVRGELPATRLALLSLAPIGEDPAHEAWARMEAYTEAIRKVARGEGTTYLPLNERMTAYLREHEADRSALPPRLAYHDGLINVGTALALHASGLTWNDVSRRNGLLLLTDTLHLNERAGEMVAGLIAGWLEGQSSAGGDT